MMIRDVLVILILNTTACSNSATPVDAKLIDGKTVDAVRVIDAPKATDAAQMSTVVVVANCTGVATGDIATTITTSGFTFSPNTATIAAGKYVKFTTSGNHNFQNQPGATAASTFSSGSPGSQTNCLQFTVAGTYPFECIVHAGMGMTGTLTVN